MGCDIHVYVEKKVEDGWQPVKGLNRWYGQFDSQDKYALEGWAYNGRNYDLFALLADVRNHGGHVEPLADAKGLPEDVSETIKKIADRWGWDGHSHSYFTLSELQEVKEDLCEVSDEFGTKSLDMLALLAEDDPESVRMVFWFDN